MERMQLWLPGFMLLLLLPLLLRRRRPLSGVLTINSILWAHAGALARNTRALGALTCGHRAATSEHSVDARALNRHSYTGSGQHTSSTTNTATHQKKSTPNNMVMYAQNVTVAVVAVATRGMQKFCGADNVRAPGTANLFLMSWPSTCCWRERKQKEINANHACA